MEIQMNDVYYIQEFDKITPVKIMRKQGDSYIVQRIGSCGALFVQEKDLLKKEPQQSAQSQIVKVQLSDKDVQ